MAAVVVGVYAATPSDEEILTERRQMAMDYMRKMATVIWRATEDIDYAAQIKVDPDDITGRLRIPLVAGRLYQGVPYSYAGSTGESFMEYASDEDGDGIYEVAGLSWRALHGNSFYSARIGNDCSGAINQSWGLFGSSNEFCATKYWNEAHGYIPVGTYEDFDIFNYGEFFSEKGTQGTYGVCEINGADVMYEAYAQLMPADAVVNYKTGGHTMMVISVNLQYKNGKVDPDKSTITTIHQTKSYSNEPNQAHYFHEGLQEDVYQIMGVDDVFTFRYLYRNGFLPVTCKELRDPSPIPEVYVKDSITVHNGDNIVDGIISSNRIIDTVTMTITDRNGNEVQKGTVSTQRISDGSFYGFNMRQFVDDAYYTMRGYVNPYVLPAGQYHCNVVCKLNGGATYTVRDFDFDWTPISERTVDHTGNTCPMCDAEDVTWKPITKGITEKTILNGPNQHYYLDADITNTNLYHLEEMYSTVCLDLNGHSITSTMRTFLTNTGTTLNIMGQGSVCGGEAGSYFGAALDIFGHVNLFGGNYRLGKAVEYPVISTRGFHARVDMYDTVTVEGRADVNTSSVLMQRGIFNMHGGKVTGGRAVHGGNFHIGYKSGTATDGSDTYACELYMFGGVIENGTASERGGNVYVVNEGVARFYENALVTGGSAKNGGNIEAYAGAYVTIDGTTVKDGYASSRGGNLYAYSVKNNTQMVVNNATIENGTAVSAGGNIEAYGGLITLNNSTVRNGKTTGSSTYGGNIDVRKSGGTVILNSGTVSDGVALRRGGNVVATGLGTFIMNGGTVTGGTVKGSGDYGKSVFVFSGGNMIMNGGIIESATTTNEGFGNGIYVYDNSALTVAGTARVVGEGGLYINTGCKVHVDNSFAGEAGIRWSADVKQTMDTTLPATAGICGSDVEGVFTSGGSFAGILRCETVEGGSVTGVNGQLLIAHTEHSWDNGVYTPPTTEANGYTTFSCAICGHKANVEIGVTAVTLRPEAAGLYFNGSFRVDESVTVRRQGITLSLFNNMPVADGTDETCLYTTADTSVLVSDILKRDNGRADNIRNGVITIYARAYVELTDGTYVYSDVADANLQEVVQIADQQLDSLTEVQRTEIGSMYAAFKDTMDLWQIPNLKQAFK